MAVNSKEVWKDIAGYDGLYQVSSLGNVRNIKLSRPVKPYVNDNGYCIVGLYNKATGKHRHYRMHRLVADTFISNPENKRTVNHKDGNKLNNAVNNLEWATHKENINHAHKTGLIVISEKQRQAARRNIATNRLYAKPEKACWMIDPEKGTARNFNSIKEAAQFVGGVSSAIVCCCQGKKKTYKGCKWGYLDAN